MLATVHTEQRRHAVPNRVAPVQVRIVRRRLPAVSSARTRPRLRGSGRGDIGGDVDQGDRNGGQAAGFGGGRDGRRADERPTPASAADVLRPL